jgi:hypothetical protein
MLKEQFKDIKEFIEAWLVRDGKISMNVDWAQRYIDAGYHRIIISQFDNWTEVHDWCEEELGREHYSWNGANFWFETEEDAFRFALRWGGA